MSTALDFTYRYVFPSGLGVDNESKPKFSLSTCNANHDHPYFFDGRVLFPEALGSMLVTLSEVVKTHFFLQFTARLDPVLTSNENLLRLEGFSGCCGVYVRVDLPADFFEGDCHGRGTTNVDFNNPMCSALRQLRNEEDVRFAVGKDRVELSRDGEKIVEKKVKLPLRWIKSFSEVQAYQPNLRLQMEIDSIDALRLVSPLRKTLLSHLPCYLVGSGKTIRMSQHSKKGSVKVLGTHRLKIIEPLLPLSKKVKVWFDSVNDTSAWEICFQKGSFFLMLSPEVYRGFSGEGQNLSSLANSPADSIIRKVQAQLKWQSEIDPSFLANEIGINETEATSALAVLGSRGLAGFDVSHGHYFHRELPFDMSKIESQQPRLKNARKLVEKNKITKQESDSKDENIYHVPGTGITHRVRLQGSNNYCTCPWFSKYQGSRGMCKHILAAQLIQKGEN